VHVSLCLLHDAFSLFKTTPEFMFLRADNSKHRPLVPVDMPRKNSNVSICGVILIRNRLTSVFTAGAGSRL
jgi:hypothetical protein